MIWWPLITKYEFQPEWGSLIQLTEGVKIRYTVFADGVQAPKYKFEVYINDSHYVINHALPMSVQKTYEQIGSGLPIFHVLSITREKKVITMTINGELRKYYLKTPIIWKVNKL